MVCLTIMPIPACRYVSGDFRFRNGYCKSNPRKMVTMWAEKELRNLMRLKAAGENYTATTAQPTLLQMLVGVLVFGDQCRFGKS